MISKKDSIYLEGLLKKYEKLDKSNENVYPLLDKGFSTNDIIKGIEVLLSKEITMSNITRKFENEFGKFIGSKYALMVNSGSSANLLAAFALINPLKKNKLKRGDEFIIPSLCWSTSLWPMIQAGLKPKFIDVDLKSFCLDENLLVQKKYRNCRAIMNIHILGNCSNIKKITNFAKKNKIYIISLLGKSGGVLKKISNKSIVVNSKNTGTIQEIHKMILHSICDYLEDFF